MHCTAAARPPCPATFTYAFPYHLQNSSLPERHRALLAVGPTFCTIPGLWTPRLWAGRYCVAPTASDSMRFSSAYRCASATWRHFHTPMTSSRRALRAALPAGAPRRFQIADVAFSKFGFSLLQRLARCCRVACRTLPWSRFHHGARRWAAFGRYRFLIQRW